MVTTKVSKDHDDLIERLLKDVNAQGKAFIVDELAKVLSLYIEDENEVIPIPRLIKIFIDATMVTKITKS